MTSLETARQARAHRDWAALLLGAFVLGAVLASVGDFEATANDPPVTSEVMMPAPPLVPIAAAILGITLWHRRAGSLDSNAEGES